MAQPVWVLSVDLQTKTATFQSGMAEAARSARTAFQDIGTSARKGAEDVEDGTIDVRHSLGALDNALRGNHAAAMTDFIRLWQNSAIVMGLMPFATTIAGILLISGTVVEAIKKLREMAQAHEKLTNDMTDFGTAVNNTWDGLDTKIRQAEERADELRNDHLGALQLKLEDIDHASMGELVKSLEAVAKASDAVFKDLAGHWYTIGIGSDGATHALQQFKLQYDSLLAQGNDSAASDLLHGTLDSAKQVLALQKEAAANSGTLFSAPGANADLLKGFQAQAALKQYGVGFTQKEVAAQQQLVDVLNAQVASEGKINELKNLDKGNAKTQTGNEAASRRAAADKEAADSQLRMASSAIASDKATADARLTIQHASIEERLRNDITFADRERDAQLAANQTKIAALDKAGKDYANQLKTLDDKALEIQQDHDTKVTEMKARATVEEAQRDLQNLQQSEREKIDATRQGSSARLSAIDAAIKEEQEKGLQQTNFYRELLTSRTELIRQMNADAAKDKESAAKEQANNQQKMAELALAAETEHTALLNSGRRVSDQQRMAQSLKAADEDFRNKQDALNKEIAGLDKSGKDYDSKLKQLQDRETQLVQQHENQITAIKDKAVMDRNSRLLAADQRLNQSLSQGLSQALMRHETFGRMMNQIGNQIVGGMIQNAIQSMLADDMTKEKDAAAAARKMFLAGAHFPFPANIVMAPTLAAAAFATVMAFEGGTDRVPGATHGDTVPAMLTPGEGVVPGGVMDGLRNVARNGGFHSGPQVHVHVRPTYHVQTIDGDGMKAALEKHTDVLQKHFEHTVRRMNH